MTDAAVAGAYSATGAAWQSGPGRVYDRLADELTARCPIALGGASVLDIGAGTGAATRAAQRRGASVIAVDVAIGMLAADARDRPPAVVGDALALPFPNGAFDAVVAAFSLNHLTDPVAGLREAARVVRREGALVVAAYASDDGHPVRDAVEAAVAARGWTPPPWYDAVRRDAAPRLATPERAVIAAHDAGLRPATVAHVAVPFPDLGPADLVAWRLGMAQVAPFVDQLPPDEQAALVADAIARLGDAATLVRTVIVLAAVVT